jgi:hypothetical protein
MPSNNTEGYPHPNMHSTCNGDTKHKTYSLNHNENEKFLPQDRIKRKDANENQNNTKETKKDTTDKVDVIVHMYETGGCSRRWTNREKYLLSICSLLFFACVAFIIVAFIRDTRNHGK